MDLIIIGKYDSIRSTYGVRILGQIPRSFSPHCDIFRMENSLKSNYSDRHLGTLDRRIIVIRNTIQSSLNLL